MKNFGIDFTAVLGMTAGTQFAWNSLISLDKEENITRYFKEDFPIRTVKEELERVIDEKATKSGCSHDKIVKVLKKKCGDTNVNNWLNGKAKALTKESALKIAFALEMTYMETSWFLMQGCWLDGLYMRDYKDIIYRYCLDNKMDFTQAQTLIEKHSYLDNANPNINTIVGSMTVGTTTKFEKASMGAASAVTNVLDERAKTVSGLDELDIFLEQNREYFGTFRRKAYEKFMELYTGIKNSIVDKPADVPTDEIICDLIAMGVPSLKGKKAIVNDVMKKIAEDALSRPTLSEIVGRQPIKRKGDDVGKITEVKRKHLILFWLYLYNPELADIGDNKNDRDSKDLDSKVRESEITKYKDLAFEECIDDINDNLLEPCGMPLLDPRNPFDWVVMNAIRHAYFSDDDSSDSDTVSRINRVMALLFDRSREDEDVTGHL